MATFSPAQLFGGDHRSPISGRHSIRVALAAGVAFLDVSICACQSMPNALVGQFARGSLERDGSERIRILQSRHQTRRIPPPVPRCTPEPSRVGAFARVALRQRTDIPD